MVHRIICLLVGIVVCFALVACSNTLPADEVAMGFETPISNQMEMHQEGEHEGHDMAEMQSAEAQAIDEPEADGEVVVVEVTPQEAAPSDHVHLDPTQATAEMGVALVPSELVVGKNRFAVGLFVGEGQVVHNAEVHFDYFDLTNPQMPVLESHAEATAQQSPDGLTTIFTHEREFARAGEWGVEVEAKFPDGTAAIKRIGFTVLAESASPAIGDAAPVVDTQINMDVDNDLSKLTSALTPNPAFYEQSLADALTNGKPTVLLFATPAFCQTRFCGPAYEITSELEVEYGDQINFIHVEIYSGLPDPAATNWEVAPAMTAFGLSTEPWLFLLDSHGVVVYRVEGMFTADEVESHFPELLGS